MSRLSDLVRNRFRLDKAQFSLRFREERLFFSRSPRSTRIERPTILFASIHKAASVHVWQVIRWIAGPEGYLPSNPEGYQFHCHVSRRPRLNPSLIPACGYLLGPFRSGFRRHESPQHRFNFYQSKILIQLRDPRDTLTSQYFSFLHIHAVNSAVRGHVLSVRAEAARGDINDHVWDRAGFLEDLLDEYTRLFCFPNCQVVHYEDMVLRPSQWIHEILDFLEIDSAQARRRAENVIGDTTANVRPENIHSHKRQILPGDHRRKLSAAAIASLNRRYARFFEALKSIGRLPASYQIDLGDAANRPAA